MGIHRRILFGVIGLLAAGAIAAPTALALPATHAKLNPGGAQKFWTPKRMQRAVPLDRPTDEVSAGGSAAGAAKGVPPAYISQAVPDPTAQPYPAVGKVFFRIDGGLYVCSAAIIDSPGGSLVFTAGHCIRDPGRRGEFATKWVFVPGFDEGSRPYGAWPAKVIWTNRGWVKNNQHFDFSAAIIRPKSGQTVQDAVGSALPIDPGPAYDQGWQAVGFPEANVWGQNMWRCLSGFYRRDTFAGSGPDPVGIACDMGGGSSGGPWITESGGVGAVTSYGYKNRPGVLYGTYLGSAANNLYNDLRKKH